MSEPKIVIPGPEALYWVAEVSPSEQITNQNIIVPNLVPGQESIDPRILVPYGLPRPSEYGFGYADDYHLELFLKSLPHEEGGRQDLFKILELLSNKALEEKVNVMLIGSFATSDNGTGWRTWFTYQPMLYREVSE